MRHLIGTSAHRRDRRIGADALRPNTCLRRLRLRRANLHQRPDEPTQKPTQIGGFCASKGLILPLKTPFLGLFGGTFTGFYKNTKSYVIECNREKYPVSKERMFWDIHNARMFVVGYIVDTLDTLSAKVGYSHKDVMLIMKLYSEGVKYNNQQLNKLLSKEVEIELKNDENSYVGRLCYQSEIKVNEILYENIYYIIPTNCKEIKYITFIPRNLKKIKEINNYERKRKEMQLWLRRTRTRRLL